MALCRRLLSARAQSGTAGERDFKTRLQEVIQQGGRRLPQHEIVEVRGPEHDRSFEVALVLEGEELGRGVGRARLEAEQAVAEAALARLDS